MKDITQFINEYCDTTTQRAFQVFESATWIDVDKNGDIQGFISYFPLDEVNADFDMVITHSKNKKYSLNHWRALKHVIENRTGYLVINSDKTNQALVKGAKKYGGIFIGDDIHFPPKEEGE